MKVKELIEQLQTMPPEMLLVVPGYEGGLNELGRCSRIKILLDQHDEWYYGRHEEDKNGDTDAVYIG
jgi:hypothetical protein